MEIKNFFLITTILAGLTTLSVLQSPAALQTYHLPELILGQLLSLTTVVGIVILLDRYLFKHWFGCSFLRIAGTRALMQLAASAGLAALTVNYYRSLVSDLDTINLFWSYFLLNALVFFGTTLLIEVSRLAGKRALEKLILGSYHRPKKEERIFLFIDLKESTRLSKELPLETYSMLIKEFFRDIDAIMEQFSGEIYQYAGDQVIVSWPAEKGNFNKAVQSFNEFYKRMKSKREDYAKRYGNAPRFKAALHSGIVVGTWAGRQKRELVFQGEVLNIAAKITGLAKNLSHPFLLTEQIVSQLSLAKEKIIAGGLYTIKGIEQPVSIYFLRMEGNTKSTTIPRNNTWRPLPVSKDALIRDAMME